MDIESEYPYKYTKRVKKTKKKMIGDSVSVKKQKQQTHQLSELHEIIEDNHRKNTQTLLLGRERTDFFVTEDSRKYILTKQQCEKDYRYDRIDSRGCFDGVSVRYVKNYSTSERQYNSIVTEFRSAQDVAVSFRRALQLDLSPIRMWQMSLAGAVLFGMVSMSMIYSNFGQSAFAKGGSIINNSDDKNTELVIDTEKEKKDEIKKIEKENKKQVKEEDGKKETKDNEWSKQQKELENPGSVVVGEKKKVVMDSVQEKTAKTEKENSATEKNEEATKKQKSIDSVTKKTIDDKVVMDNGDDESIEKLQEKYSLEIEANELVDGYPIEKMLPYILEQDPEVAKYMIAMAKQESQWGKRVPVLNGQDCYNYWGYRSQRKLMGSGGHTCFNSRKDAVETVGKRIHELIYKYDRKTANRLIVWKCGSTCESHSQDSINRWINTVQSNYNKLSE